MAKVQAKFICFYTFSLILRSPFYFFIRYFRRQQIMQRIGHFVGEKCVRIDVKWAKILSLNFSVGFPRGNFKPFVGGIFGETLRCVA